MSARRRVSAVLAATIVLAGAVVSAGYFYLGRSIQPRRGDETLPGLAEPVEVSFDEWAIPSVFAHTEQDVYRAQGFLHASERLWQLELFQRMARGRLAELFGEPALDTDRLVRTLDLWGAAGATLDALPTRERALLEAYAAGVNARIDTWRGPWPIEFTLLGIEPQAWSARASIAIEKIMALDLSGWQTELSRTRALARLPESLRAVLDPGYPAWGPTILQDGPPPAGGARLHPGADSPRPWASGEPSGGVPTASTSEGPASGASDPDSWDPLATLAAFGLGASNSWALGESRTSDGHPLLANDMHLALRAPSTWYLNALHAEDVGLHVAGLSIPGAPGVVVGFNRTLAWAFTNAMLDDADFLVESISPDGSRYLDDGAWRPFAVREEEIAVHGRDAPAELRVRSTTRGPVITDVVPAGGATLSLLWTGRESRGAAEGLFGMNRAATATAFEAAAREFQAPHQNVIYATTGGDLGARLVGSIPHRGGVETSVPVAAARLPDGWRGYVPVDSMPALEDPGSDYLASANNLQSWPSFGVVGVDYPLPYRVRRIVDRVQGAHDWTVGDMLALQRDTRSLWADRWLPRMIASARRIGAADAAGALAGWDRSAGVDSREATLFYVWLYRLRQLIAADEYGEGGWFPDIALERVLERGEGPWIDDVTTPASERLADLEDEAVRTAVRAADGRTWGAVHRERSVHPLGEIGWLDRLFRFDVGPYPAPGGRHTVRPDDYHRRSALDSTSWSLPITTEYGPSERFVAHLDPEAPAGYFLLPTGQSGNPLDRHYRDMSRVWTGGALIEVSLDREAQRAREQARLRLEPVP